MSFLNFFFGSSPKKLERKGDNLSASGQWVTACRIYEQALRKLQKGAGHPSKDTRRIVQKMDRAREELARERHHDAQNLIENGSYDEARDMLTLALEISRDPQFKTDLQKQLELLAEREKLNLTEPIDDYLDDFGDHDEQTDPEMVAQRPPQMAPAEEFFILIQTLPEDVQGAYLAYGPDFQDGYVALNQGRFEDAVQSLLKAMKIAGPTSYVSLELAAAYLHMDRAADAQKLLENFIPHHPDALPAYQLLCEIYWEQENHTRVEHLISSIPPDLSESIAVVLLKGENLYQAGSYEEVKAFYENILSTYGWHEAVARALAKTCETLGLPHRARRIYQDIIERCATCGKHSDPHVRHKYAELSFAAGRYGTDILEMYLALARELPENAPRYYDRVSRIYSAQGNAQEAARFRAFSTRSPNGAHKNKITS
jgi:tetratricopeptide (TPR) repeat protein